MKAIHYHPGRKLTANCLNTLIDRVPVAEQKRSLNHELFNLACLLFEMARSGGACELMKARLCEIGMENAQDEGKRAVIFKHYAKGTLDEHFASVLLVTLSFSKRTIYCSVTAGRSWRGITISAARRLRKMLIHCCNI